MALVYLNEQTNFNDFDISNWDYLVPTNRSSSSFSGYYSYYPSESTTFEGFNFTYAGDGSPLGGTVTRFYEKTGSLITLDVQQISVSVQTIIRWVDQGATSNALESVLNGNDIIYSSQRNDYIRGYNGSDIIYGQGGNDTLNGDQGDDALIGSSGNDYISGGSGSDSALFNGPRNSYTLSFNGSNHAGWINGSDGYDNLNSIEILSFDDGRLVYDELDEVSVAYRMYDSAFNRTPDPSGMNAWTTALQSGLSTTDMARGFVASPEFQASYGNLSNVQFVEQLYQNVLNRHSDVGGLSHWSGLINNGQLDRGQALAGFSESMEHRAMLKPTVDAGIWDVNETAASIARLYYAALDRAPDAGGLTNWTNAVESGLALSGVADSFLFSPEFQGKYGTLSNEQFIEQIYQNVLDRPSDPGGFANWTGFLNSGQLDRGDVLLGFSESLEHQIKTQGYLNDGIFLL
jgi:hypothetical protein